MRRLWPVAALVVGWSLTRAVVVWLLRERHAWVRGDLGYFADSLAAVPEVGLAGTLVEYPLPGVVVVALPGLLVATLGLEHGYDDAVLALSLAADAGYTVLLARFARPGRRAALAVWLLAVPLLGATSYARFDLVPGLLAGTALLLLARHPRLAAGAAALATGLKLWPALVLPALAVPEASRRQVLRTVAVTGGLLVAASVAVAGWGRLLSPLAWQAERGLQIESLAATPAMVGWVLAPDRYSVAFTEHHAFEVSGPGTAGLLLAARVVSLLAVPALLALWLAGLGRGRSSGADTVAWSALAAVGLFLVTSPVLSPQYLLWLLPLAAAATGLTRARGLPRWSVLLLVATAATQVVFPELYGHLTGRGDLAGWAVLALVVRNTLLLALVGWAVAAAGREVSGAARWSASRRARRGGRSGPCGGGPTTRR